MDGVWRVNNEGSEDAKTIASHHVTHLLRQTDAISAMSYLAPDVSAAISMISTDDATPEVLEYLTGLMDAASDVALPESSGEAYAIAEVVRGALMELERRSEEHDLDMAVPDDFRACSKVCKSEPICHKVGALLSNGETEQAISEIRSLAADTSTTGDRRKIIASMQATIAVGVTRELRVLAASSETAAPTE